MVKIRVRGYGATYDLIKLTDEEAKKAQDEELGDLCEYEFENGENPEFTACGADWGSAIIDLLDENDELIKEYESSDFEKNEEHSVTVHASKKSTMLAIISEEKGTFAGFEIDIDKDDFEPEKLELVAAVMDELVSDHCLIFGAVYDGEELDEVGDTGSVGKSMQHIVFTTCDFGCLDGVICEE